MTDKIGAWRGAALVAVAWLGAAAVASVQAVVPRAALPGLKPGPDLILIVVVFVGLSGRGGVGALAALATLLGYLGDLSGGSPKGLHMLVYLVVALLARAASARLLVRRPVVVALSCGFFAALAQLGLLAARLALDPSVLSGGGWGPLRTAGLAVLATAVLAPVVFAVLRRIDRRVGRLAARRLVPRVPRSLSQVP